MRIAVYSRQGAEDFKGGGGEQNGLLPCLAIRQPQGTGCDIDIVPAGFLNFPQSGASEYQEANKGCKVRSPFSIKC
jgi:hypothetical protein